MSTPEVGEEVAPSPASVAQPVLVSAEPIPSAPLPPEPAKSAGNPILNWFLVRPELARAQDEANRFSVAQREYVRRAKLAFETGELALAPGNAVRSGSTAPLSTNLFRQAVYWALLSQNPPAAGILPSPEQAWASADPALLAGITRTEAELAQLAATLPLTFAQLAEGTPEVQLATVAVMQHAAGRLVGRAQRVQWQLEWSKLKRLTRLAFAALLVILPLVAIVLALPEKPDLAKGKPWRTSSTASVCHPEKSECGGVTTDILFHTANESNPWFEYDFGAPLAFSSLTIKNRSDYGPERAVPLVVEVSNDDKHFTQVARRDDTFGTWKPSFPTQHARYLRLRIARESMLHLEAVKVHP